jgi:type IV pilus assembly protein PilY1
VNFESQSLRTEPTMKQQASATNHTTAPVRTSMVIFALRTGVGRLRRSAVSWLALPLAAVISMLVTGATAPVNIPKINLAADPLYAAAAGDKPAMTLALSVEYPTVGAQYTPGTTSDNTYSANNEYLGYYDAEACYRYNNTPTETPGAGLTAADFKRFDHAGRAIALATADPLRPLKTSRMCNDAFSGNFLNWATSSAIDMLRLALSGGDRYIDRAGLTILQRAVLPDGNPVCMWNSSNFPAKQLLKDGGGAGKYWGAVPNAMVIAAAGDAIWVANTLNRIYFKAGSDSSGGGCGGSALKAAYNLSGPSTSTNVMGPIANQNVARPTGTWTTCIGGETGSCSFTGTKEVWYGANNTWKVAPVANSLNCSSGCNAVFGDPIVGTPKQVYYRDYTGSWTPPLSPNALNSDGFFFSRVQVCHVDQSNNLSDVRDYNLCRLYPNGTYKPTGTIQKYSDQVRLSAFGYLLDQTQSYSGGRYGGVLRAPMKYVGSKTFDENGIDNTPTGGNPNTEWDVQTGVFASNPDSHAKGVSGVINYLNKFGRTGTQGFYKIYDPIGEMYYEAIRYLQGMQPSAGATSGITAAMEDGFPVYTTWTDPFGGSRTSASDYACVKNNIVVIGDVNTHDAETRIPTASAANNIPDIRGWRGVVQAFERNTTATTYLDGTNTSRNVGNPNGSNGNVPTNGQTSQIMGTAYWAHTHDIRGTDWTADPAKQRPGLRVKTFTFDVNEYGDQNNANTRRNANQLFMAAKYGGFETLQPNSGGNTFNTKGNPFQKEDGTNSNDVWQKPAEPGEASTYYLQSSARGVLNAFEDIFGRAASAASNIAGSSNTGRNLAAQANSTIYQGSFDTADWSGDVQATVVQLTNGNLTISPTPTWSAANKLLTRASPETTRTIVVGNDGVTPIPAAVPFTWADLSTNAKAALNRPDSVSAVDSLGARRVDYLRGKRTDEVAVAPATQPVFRPRAQLLGDIVNSGVAYSGKLPSSMNAAGYAAFASASVNRTAAVYAGSNDGMLHAFDAATGVELFGYIPSWVVPNLSLLTNRTYAANHRSYVDSTPAVAAADLGSGSPDWRTVLVSGTGGGGKGVFALDVTNPASFSASNVLWEFTHEHDIDMGFVVASPQILRFRTSARSATTATYKWFAVVASGINNYVGTNANGTYSDGNPALFLLDLSKPAGAPWVLNSNYYKAMVPVDTTLATTTPAGLITFKPEFGAADEVVRIYMGDLHGKLWRLDFGERDGPSQWKMGDLSSLRTIASCTTNCTAAPLFIAKDAMGKVQPISMAPTVAFSGTMRANYVAFGTGKYLEVLDKTTSGQQSFYVVYDDINSKNQAVDASSGSVVGGRQWLQAGTVDMVARTVTVPSFRWGRRTNADVSGSTSTYSGWYFDFPDAGERQVFNIVVNGDLLEFNTLFPSSTTANICGSNDGGGNSYAMNMDSGSGSFIRSNVGVLGEAVVLQIAVSEVNRNSSITTSPSDSTGRRIRRTTTKTLAAGSKGLTEVKTTTQEIVTGRLSWRRINNYQDLKNAP